MNQRHTQSAPKPKEASVRIDLATGERVAGRFFVQRKLGTGASGAVYQVFDEQRGVAIAVKFLTAIDPGSLFRFKSEFRSLANLTHPNLLQLYELLTHEDAWLLTMELIEGTDFLSYLRPALPEPPDVATSLMTSRAEPTTLVSGSSSDPLSSAVCDTPRTGQSSLRTSEPRRLDVGFDEPRLREAFLQLCDGLSALHRAKRLHRDLKPANVLVRSADSRVVICDFGLALEGGIDELAPDPEQAADDVFPTHQREVAGTLAYMSPEQAQGELLTPAADWYCVGVMLYQALTGQLPYKSSLPLKAALRAKLHTAPTPPQRMVPGVPRELSELALSLLHPEPLLRAGFDELVVALEGRSTRTHRASSAPNKRPFVGRDGAISALLGALRDSQNGQPTIALVSGKSGMGKSSLVQHVLSEIEQRASCWLSPLILRARCYEREELPYKALDPLIDALSTHLLRLEPAELAPLLPDSLPYLAALFPALKRVRTIAELGAAPAVADPRDRRRLAFRSFRELCRNLSKRHAVVLSIDDLQWGDLDSAQLFRDLLAPPAAPAVLVVCAYRSEDEKRSPLIRLLRQTHALDPDGLRLLDVPIGALAGDDACRLACELLGERPGAAQSAELIAREAEGSPFFVRELAEYVIEHGVEAAGRIRLEGLVREKLSALAPESRHLLSLIALAGRPIEPATVKEASRLGPATFRALRELEVRRLVLATRVNGAERLECQHDRIREAICQVLPDARRQQLQRDLAEVLEREVVPDWDALLEHWRGAGDRAKAGEYALRGARAAEDALAFKRAADLYRDALALLSAQDPRRRETRERLGHALILAGRGAEAAKEFLALIPEASERQVMTYRMLATTQLLRAGELAEGFDELERADDLFGVRYPRSEVRALAMMLARKTKIRLSERRIVVRDADRDPAGGERLDRLWEVAAAVSIADLLRGSVYGAELMLRAMEQGDPSHIAGACGLEAVAASAANHPARTQKMLDLAVAAGESCARPLVIARVRGMQAICCYLQGRWLESIRLARESQSLTARAAPLNWDRAIMFWWEMASAAMAGQLTYMSATIPEALREAEARGDVYAATSFRTYRSCWAWLAAGRPELADQQVDCAERDWLPYGYQFQHWHMTYARSEVDLYRGTPERSLARLSQDWSRARLVRQVETVRSDMLCTRGRLLLSSARLQRGASVVSEVAADGNSLIAQRLPWTIGLGTLLLAGAASFERPAAALVLLARAERQFVAADMPLHAAVCRFRSGQLQGGPNGQARADAALQEITRLGAKRPEPFAAMLAPMRL